jgi:hypothetical protein
MSFPSSPVNTQVAIINGVRYVYSSSLRTWTKIPTPNIDQYARSVANSAYSRAVSGGVNVDTYSFIGDGTTVNYNLPKTPNNENQIIVALEGVVQFKNTYSVVGNTLTFSTAPYNGYNFEVTVFDSPAISEINFGGSSATTGSSPSIGKTIALTMILG